MLICAVEDVGSVRTAGRRVGGEFFNVVNLKLFYTESILLLSIIE